MKILESKTLVMWFLIFAIGLGAIFIAAFVDHFLHVQVPLLSDFLDLLKVGGGGATVRNLGADHVMPSMERWKTQQTTGFGGPVGPAV